MTRPSVERLREAFDLDDEAGLLRWRIRPNRRIRVGDAAGCAGGCGYFFVRLDGARLLVHRAIFAMVSGFWPERVDHINGITTDNRPRNLRAATRSENQWNSKTPSNNASGIKGVCWDRRRGKWLASIGACGVVRKLGRFDDLEAAAAAVREARDKAHGDFARHA